MIQFCSILTRHQEAPSCRCRIIISQYEISRLCFLFVAFCDTPFCGMTNVDPSCQLWVGNIPQHLDEKSCLEELAAYGFRPNKLVLRKRPGKDSMLGTSFRCRVLCRSTLLCGCASRRQRTGCASTTVGLAEQLHRLPCVRHTIL